MKSRVMPILATVAVILAAMFVPVAHGASVVQRSLDDAFVDTFFLEDVEPIRAQMPSNWSDPKRNLLADVRVDNLDAVAGPYGTIEEMFKAFYDNQIAFNSDPNRNRIEMYGTVDEVLEDDGTVLIVASIVYKNLPLTLFNLQSWNTALTIQFEPGRARRVLEGGFLNGWFYVEMEIPERGAPLHFWKSLLSGGLRRNVFAGTGEGWLLDGNGQRSGRAVVDIFQDCGIDACTKELVEFTRIRQ